MDDDGKFTISTRIGCPEAIDFLQSYNCLFSRVLRLLFVDYIIKEKSLVELKSAYIDIHGLMARQFNSIATQVRAKWNARKEQYEEHINLLEAKIKSVEQWIAKEKKSIAKKQGVIEKINKHKKKLNEFNSTPKGRRPRLAKALRNIQMSSVLQEISQSENMICLKKQKINVLTGKLKKAQTRLNKKSLCFGGEKLFKAQFNLEQTKFASHQAWKEAFDLQRNGQSYWVGSKDETKGNQNAQYNPDLNAINLRVPPALEDRFGKYIQIPVDFKPKFKKDIQTALERKIAVSFRFVEKIDTTRTGNNVEITDVNGNFLEYQTKMYCQVSFDSPLSEEPKTSLSAGAIGIDLNEDHLAVTVTNASGNPVEHFTQPFNMAGRTTDQRKAIVGDFVADLCEKALESGKSIVIEDLDFKQKKTAIKEKGKGKYYNRMLSNFFYRQFRAGMQSRCKKMDIELKSVNPAFTSVIGAYKFSGYKKMSFHHCAALAIARRAQGFSERPKTVTDMHSPDWMEGLNVGQAPELQSNRKFKHIWSYWRFYTKKIRAQMNSVNKNSVFGKLERENFLVNPSRPSGLFAILGVLNDNPSQCRTRIFMQGLQSWIEGNPNPDVGT